MSDFPDNDTRLLAGVEAIEAGDNAETRYVLHWFQSRLDRLEKVCNWRKRNYETLRANVEQLEAENRVLVDTLNELRRVQPKILKIDEYKR
jgi:hypothetical protein